MSKENSQPHEVDAYKNMEITEEEIKHVEKQQMKQRAVTEKDLVILTNI